MNYEDKQLLLKDLCGRSSYGVIVKVPEHISINDLKVYGIETPYKGSFLQKKHEYYLRFWNDSVVNIDECKPYLRPMSSMTQEERKELETTMSIIAISTSGNIHLICATTDGFDWLNAHHFDYRGLINKGLVLEAPEGMYSKTFK